MTHVYGILQARILEKVAFPVSRVSSQFRDRIQGSKPGLAHCRRILYPRSYQGSPKRACAILSDVALPVMTSMGRQQLPRVCFFTHPLRSLSPLPQQFTSLVLEAFSTVCISQLKQKVWNHHCKYTYIYILLYEVK